MSFILEYALLCVKVISWTRTLLLQACMGWEMERSKLSLPFLLHKQKKRGSLEEKLLLILPKWWGNLPKYWFWFCKNKGCMKCWVLVSCIKLFDMESHSVVKRSKLWTKGFVFWNWFSYFCVWTQRGYGKANKSLCFIMHLNLENCPKCK